MKLLEKMKVFLLIGAFIGSDNLVFAPEIDFDTTHESDKKTRESLRQEESIFDYVRRKISEHVQKIKNHFRSDARSSREVVVPDKVETPVAFDGFKHFESKSDLGFDAKMQKDVVDSGDFVTSDRSVNKAVPVVGALNQELANATVDGLKLELEMIQQEMDTVSPVEMIQRDDVRHILKVLGLDPQEITEEIESAATVEQQRALLEHLLGKNGVAVHSIQTLAVIRDYFKNTPYLARVEEKLFEYLNQYRESTGFDNPENPKSNTVLKYIIGRTMLRLERIMEVDKLHDRTKIPSVLDNFTQVDWEYATGGISKKERAQMDQMN